MGSYEEALHELQHCVQSLDSINLSTTPSNLYNYKSQHLKLINNELILAVLKFGQLLRIRTRTWNHSLIKSVKSLALNVYSPVRAGRILILRRAY